MRRLVFFVFVVSLMVIGGLLVTACAAPKEQAPAPKAEATPAPVVTTPAPKAEAPPAAPVAPPATSPTASGLDAKKLYDTNCAACHGPTRQGVTGLAPALTPESMAKLSDNDIRNAILKGKPNTAMPGFEERLSAEEVNALLRLIKSTSP